MYCGCLPTRKMHAAVTSTVLFVVLVYLTIYFDGKLCSRALNMDRGLHVYLYVCSRRGYVAGVTKACWSIINSCIFPKAICWFFGVLLGRLLLEAVFCFSFAVLYGKVMKNLS